ncbi:MAG: DegV family protein [Lachnospiraceae bacterium]|nr:DegV family protein [Lachnospiraceae bacterium]
MLLNKSPKEKVAVIVDSCGDVPYYLAEKYGIRIVPVHIVYPEGDYHDGYQISPMVYERFPEEIPTTATPSPADIMELYDELEADGYTHVIAVCISDRLSSTINAFRIAANEYPEINSFVFNTKNISVGSGIFAIWAAKMLKKGYSFEEITMRMERKRSDSHLMFYMDTLQFLYAGGRIGKVGYLAANALHIKPVISCDKDGVYYTVAKLRGSRKSKEKLYELVSGEMGEPDAPCWVVIGHGNAPQECERMKALVEKAMPQAKILFTEQITASMAVHTGPGLIGLLIFKL